MCRWGASVNRPREVEHFDSDPLGTPPLETLLQLPLLLPLLGKRPAPRAATLPALFAGLYAEGRGRAAALEPSVEAAARSGGPLRRRRRRGDQGQRASGEGGGDPPAPGYMARWRGPLTGPFAGPHQRAAGAGPVLYAHPLQALSLARTRRRVYEGGKQKADFKERMVRIHLRLV